MNILLLIFLVPFFANATTGLHLVSECRIYDIEDKLIAEYPGAMCKFLPDGSIVNMTPDGLNLINKDSHVQWHLPGHFHHQISLSLDGKRILALSSEIVVKDGERMRLDKVMIIDLKGKVLHQVLSDELLKQAKIERKPLDAGPVLLAQLNLKLENTHFNSFYEIPKLSTKDVPSYIQQGNFIVNGRQDGIFILSPDLKTLYHHFYLSQSLNHNVHDVQVMENGHYLLFNNILKESYPSLLVSAVQEIDTKTQKVNYEFTGTPKGIFHSFVSGSIQKLDEDRYLLTHPSNGTFLLSKKENRFLRLYKATHYVNNLHFPAHQVKAYDLSQFFKNRK